MFRSIFFFYVTATTEIDTYVLTLSLHYALPITAFIFSVASVLIIVFFMKAGDDFSRLLFGLGAILALGSLIAWRWALACIAVAHIEKFPFATLCIYDGITKSEHGQIGRA